MWLQFLQSLHDVAEHEPAHYAYSANFSEFTPAIAIKMDGTALTWKTLSHPLFQSPFEFTVNLDMRI